MRSVGQFCSRLGPSSGSHVRVFTLTPNVPDSCYKCHAIHIEATRTLHNPEWFLSTSSHARYFTGALAYFAQGIPKGLLHIALPAWLAVEGVAPATIAGFLGVIMLPWAFKLLVGPLMDHYEYLPMGKRRPWVLTMQLGMVISLLGLGLIDDPTSEIGLLMAVARSRRLMHS